MYIKCWNCGQDIEHQTININDQLHMSWEQGYNQAIRDFKNDKIDHGNN